MINQRSIISGLLAVLVTAILASNLSLQASAQEQTPGLTMEAVAGAQGYFKYGEWLPLWAQIENNGPDLEAEVRVRVNDRWGTTIYATPASLPAGSRKRIPVYVLPNTFSHELEIQLVGNQKLLDSQKVVVRPQPNINYLVGLVSQQRGGLSLINAAKLPGQERPIVLIDLTLADLPERAEGLRSLNTLIINDVDTSSLTTGQKEALEIWVRQGGRLVIGGGAEAIRTTAGLPASLLPFSPRGVMEITELSGLAEYANGEAVRVPGPFVVATGEAAGAEILAYQNEHPLVLEWAAERGFVDFVALDLSATPFDAWSGTTQFWQALLSPGAAYPEWMPYDMSVRQNRAGNVTYALSNLPSLDLPSIRGLAILLSIYVLLVGPINYLVLRWRKRLHLAWITTPLFTIAFSAGAFGLGYAMRGTDLIMNKIAIIEVLPGGNASVNSYLGLFSPSRQSYEIEVNGGGLLSPISQDYDPWGSAPGGVSPTETIFVQGEPGRVRGLTVNQWSMQAFMNESTWTGFGQISADLLLEDSALVGTLVNETSITLKDAVIIFGSQFTRLGDLPPGASKEVRMELPTLVNHPFDPPISYRLFAEQLERPGPTGPSRDVQLKQSMIDSLFAWGSWYGPVTGANTSNSGGAGLSRPLLLAWLDQAPPEVQFSGRKPAQLTTALLLGQLSYHLPAGGRLSLPPGILPGTLAKLPSDGGFCGPMGMPAVYLNKEPAIFEFIIPDNILSIEGQSRGIRLDSLVLHIGTEGGWNQVPSTAIYNWLSEDWEEIEDVESGRNVIPATENVVNASGSIRLRLSPANPPGGGCYFLAMGLDGSR